MLTRLKTKAKISYYTELALSYGNDKSKIWRLFNEIIKRKKINNHSIKSLLDKKENTMRDPKLIAYSLNEHFSTVGKNINMVSKFLNDINTKAQVIPLFKGGTKEHFTCYRPNSLLPALGKLLQKVISDRTTEFLKENKVYSSHQFEFREGFSTEYLLFSA